MDLNNNANVNESNNYLIGNSFNLFNTNPHLLTSLHNLNQPNYSQLIYSIDDHVILGDKITFNVVNFNNLFPDNNIISWRPDTDKKYLLDYSHLLPSTTSKEIDFYRLTGNSEIPLVYPVTLVNNNEASLLENNYDSDTLNVGLNSNFIAGILQQAIYPTLQQFVKLPNFQELMHSIFGDNLDAGKLTQITSQWLIGNFSLLPQIKVQEESVFPTSTLGAFAGTTEKIYLSEKLFNTENTEKLGDIILEEIGHWLDKQINIADTPGDEGQLFAAVVTGKQLNADQIAEIKTEDDTTTIFADGRFLTVEQATSTVIITAAPTITIAVSDATAAETIAGQTANPGKFTLKRTGDLSSTLAVNYTVGGTATNGTDYNQLTGTATFGAGASTTTIDLTVINDAILEPQETVIVTLNSGNSYNLGTTTTATVNLVDNDKPTITIKATDAAAGETVTGQTANPGRFTLTRTGDLSSSPTVNYTVTGTAINGTDYNQLTGTATFASGAATAIIDVNVINDAILEAQETVIVTLASSENYTLGSVKTAIVNLADNDKPTITIRATDASAGETITGVTANPGRFTLTRTGDLSSSPTVNYTVTGTATNGTDYNTLTRSVTFATGAATAIVDVTPIDDAVYEGNETVIVNLASSANYILGTAKTATVNLVDNDKPTITIAATDSSAAETLTGQTANIGKLTLTRTGNKTASLTVNYTVAGTAVNGTDYQTLTKTVTFAAGSATAIIDVTPIDDAVYEGNETVIVNLASSANYVLGTAKTATVNLVDNDKPTITISATDASAAETLTGQTANIGKLTLTRTGNKTASLTVNYTVAGTAVNGTDYQTLTKTVTFAAGSATAIIDVTPINDAVYEGNETVIVNLASSANYVLGTAKTATVTLLDNDSATTVKPTVTINASDANAAETVIGETANPGRFTLTRTGDLSSSLTVSYSVAGTATNGIDYNNLSGTATFSAGVSTALINVNPIDDAIYEGGETLIVTLSSNTNYNLGTAKTATVNIADNDPVPYITIGSPNGGDSLLIDGNSNITWNDNISENVKIDLYQNGIFHSNIFSSTPSDGSETWNVSGTLFSDSNYQIKISSVNNPNLFDFSDSNFTIRRNWVQRVGSEQDDSLIAIDTDSNNNIYITGTSNSFSAGLLIKQDSVMNTSWFQTGLPRYSTGLAVDNNSNVYVSRPKNFSGGNVLIDKYDTEASLVWNRQLDGGYLGIESSIATDSNNDIYISGATASVDETNAVSYDAFIAKYNSAGTLLWTRQLGTDSYDSVRKVATDSNGNAYIYGNTTGNLVGNNLGGSDFFLAKYSSSGNLLWTRQFGTNLNDEANSLATDSNGNIYIYGNVGTNIGGQISTDVFLAKYSSSGNSLWTKKVGTTFSDEAGGIRTDNNGNVYIAGSTSGNIAGDNQGAKDVFVIKYDPSGNLLWSEQFGSSGDDISRDIAVDNNQRIYVVGDTTGSLSSTLTNEGGTDGFIRKLSPISQGLIPITVTSPNGGNTFQMGSSYNITWNDSISENVKIDLYKGDVFNRTLFTSTASDGNESWTLPSNLVAGSDYQIKISSVNNASLFDFGNANFSVTPAPFITVASPNGGETLQVGNTYNITWTDNISENVKIDLFKGGIFNSTIFSSTVSDGSESWTLPSNLVAGADYQIKISSVNNSNLYDWSNSNFTLSQSDLVITSQSVSSSVTTNSTVSISSYTYNQGAATAGSNYVRYWLSDDATLNTSTDRFLGYNSVGSLSSGTSEYDSFSFTYDASWGTGTKYIFFEADGYGYVAESNESNNLAYQAITINGSVMQYGFTYYYNVSANNVVGSGDYYEGYFYAPVGNYALGNYYDVNSNNNESGFNGKYYINSSTVQGTSSDLGKIYVTRYYDRTGSNYTSYTPYYNSLGQVSGTNYLGSEYDFIGSNDSIHKDFGQDAFEYNAPSSDIDIRLDFTYSGFNQTQINILEQAAQNWERIITRDMVPGGVIDVVVTQGSTTQYGTAWNGMWATTDFPYAIGTIATPNVRYNLSNSYDNQRGIDYHTRMHFNSSTLPTLSSNLLVRLVMHELGHALYLDEAQYDSLLGLDGVMDLNGLDARITEGVYQRLEYLGYGVDRNAIVYWS